jgi:hypothetical protein
MSYVKDFMDFMNNDMTELEEQRFAENLASDREYLSNFKSYLLITSTIKKNINAFAMPAEVKQEIFRKLGLTYPGATMSPTIPEKKEVKPKKPFRKWNFIISNLNFSRLIKYFQKYFL